MPEIEPSPVFSLCFFVLRLKRNLIRITPDTRKKRMAGINPESLTDIPEATALAQDHQSSETGLGDELSMNETLCFFLLLSGRCLGAAAFAVNCNSSGISSSVFESRILFAHLKNKVSSSVLTL